MKSGLTGPILFSQKNADKTLKCPKCNWHYKYIETLEAHIREKHNDDTTTGTRWFHSKSQTHNCSCRIITTLCSNRNPDE